MLKHTGYVDEYSFIVLLRIW